MSLRRPKPGDSTGRRSNANRSAAGKGKSGSLYDYNENRSKGGNKTGRGKPATSTRGNNSR